MFQELLKEFAELEKKKTEFFKRIKKTASLSEIFGFLFEKYPNLEAFRFRCYTPYFNDGDPCTYTVDTYPDLLFRDRVVVYNNDEDSDGWTSSDSCYSSDDSSDKTAVKVKKIHNEIEKYLSSIPEDIIEGIFGDHVEITIRSKKGKIISESVDYDHD